MVSFKYTTKNNIYRLPVPKFLTIPAVLFYVWLIVYGYQWLALIILNFLFRTHVQMSFLVWVVITIMFFCLKFYKIEE